MKVGKTLEVHAGTFTSETPLKPIRAREGRSGHAPGDARRTAPSAGDVGHDTSNASGSGPKAGWRSRRTDGGVTTD